MTLCAFCYVTNAKQRCGTCKKRAYCSRSCQKSDWSCHKAWCGKSIGEESLDWEIRDSPGKGLGVFALRDFVPREFIMHERGYTLAELQKIDQSNLLSAIDDLMPASGSRVQKFLLNCLGMRDETSDSVLCVRMSRVNHACLPNALHYQYENTHNKVLLALAPIKKGEEITISYDSPLRDAESSGFISEDHSRNVLQYKWGIVCSNNCACHSPEQLNYYRNLRRLDKEILQLAMVNPALALSKAESRIKLCETVPNLSTRSIYDAFNISLVLGKFSKTRFYARQYADINESCPGFIGALPPKILLFCPQIKYI